jgi:hypothetical protein
VSVITRHRDEVVVSAGGTFLAIRGAKGFSVARPKSARFIGLRVPLTLPTPPAPDLDPSEICVLEMMGACCPSPGWVSILQKINGPAVP